MASLETNPEERAFKSNTQSDLKTIVHLGAPDLFNLQFKIPPVTLNRNLPDVIQLNLLLGKTARDLQNSYLFWETSPFQNSKFQNEFLEVQYGSSQLIREQHLRMSTDVLSDQVSLFGEVMHRTNTYNQTEDRIFSLGGSSALNTMSGQLSGEIVYEDALAKSYASPALKAILSHKLHVSETAQFKIGWKYFEKKEWLNQLGQNNGLIEHSSDLSNLNIFNLQLAFAPADKMFLSLDYYHYLQDQLSADVFQAPFGAIDPIVLASTNGLSKDIGEVIDLRAIYSHSENLSSQLMAGWFIPGSALGQAEDKKTFEIRGEIIVNF